MFRGEFSEIGGGADFYGASVDELRREGWTSLNMLQQMHSENLTTSPKTIISGEVSSTDAVSALPRHRGDGREDGGR